jgi:carbon monoxide dehydrogenase subunit G
VPQREATFTVNAPPQELWKFLRDFEALCGCIPGVERLKIVDGRTAEFAVREKLGVVPLIVELRAQIESEDPPRKLHAVARGQHVAITIDVALQPAAGGTQMTSLFDVKGEGPLKPVVDRLFEKRATERTAQFAETLAQRFSAAPAAAIAKPGVWWRRLSRRLLSRREPESS